MEGGEKGEGGITHTKEASMLQNMLLYNSTFTINSIPGATCNRGLSFLSVATPTLITCVPNIATAKRLPPNQWFSKGIGACRPGHTWPLPGLFRIMRTHITRTGPEDTWSVRAYACTGVCIAYSECSDKIRFPQLHIKCGVAKSCPGTHTALQVPM